MSHVAQGIHTWNGKDVGLVAGKVGVGLDGSGDSLEGGTFLQLDIHHAAMYALTLGNGHRERVAHARLRTDADAMPHAHAGTEVGIGESLGGDSLEQGTHDAVAAWVPAGADDADAPCRTGSIAQRLTQRGDEGVDVEAIDGVDTKRKALKGILLDLACRRGEDGDIYIAQLTDIIHDGHPSQLSGTILVP